MALPVLRLAGLGIIALAQQSAGQTITGVFTGENNYGFSTCITVGDVDGDGVDDYVMRGGTSPGVGGGTIRLVSGATGAAVWEIYPDSNADCESDDVRHLGDFDGDDTDEIAVACLNDADLSQGSVKIHCALTGVLERTIPAPPGIFFFGVRVGPGGDLNGDGFMDLLVTGYPSGVVDQFIYAYYGPDATLGYQVVGSGTFELAQPHTIGDVTGDGLDDFAVSWGFSSPIGVTIHSGSDGAQLDEVCPVDCPAPVSFDYPYAAVPVDDLDGDGVGDFVLQQPAAIEWPDDIRWGVVRAYSGVDRQLLHEVWGPPGSGPNWEFHTMSWVAGGHDINGDGVSDYAVVAGRGTDPKSAILVSGRTGQVLYRVISEVYGGPGPGRIPVTDDGATRTGTIGDVDGDGRGEWWVGDASYREGGLRRGRIVFLSASLGDAESICDAVPNSLGLGASLILDGPISVETRFLQLFVYEAIPDSVALLAYGPEAAPTPLGDGQLCINPAGLVRYGEPFQLGAEGAGSIHANWGDRTIGFGATAWNAGSTWVLQALYRDAGGSAGFNLTNAMRVTFVE